MLPLHATKFVAQLGFQQAFEDVIFDRFRTTFSSTPLRNVSERARRMSLDFDLISMLGREPRRWLLRLIRLIFTGAGLTPFGFDRMRDFLTCGFIAFSHNCYVAF